MEQTAGAAATCNAPTNNIMTGCRHFLVPVALLCRPGLCLLRVVISFSRLGSRANNHTTTTTTTATSCTQLNSWKKEGEEEEENYYDSSLSCSMHTECIILRRLVCSVCVRNKRSRVEPQRRYTQLLSAHCSQVFI